MAAVVAPVLHKNEVAAGADDAVNTTEPPAQKVVAPLGVIVTTGFVFTVTDRAAEPVQPEALVTVTK